MPFHLTDTEWVMIVVAAIYLFECAWWVRRERSALTLLGRFRAGVRPSSWATTIQARRGQSLAAGPLFRLRVVADRRLVRWNLLSGRDVGCVRTGASTCHIPFAYIAGGP